MFKFEPSGTNSELRPTTRNDVKGGDRLRKKCRVSVGVAGDQRGKARLCGVLREGGKRGVALKHVLRRLAEHRQLVEVIHHHDGVEARSVCSRGLLGNCIKKFCWSNAGIGEVRNLVANASHGSS